MDDHERREMEVEQRMQEKTHQLAEQSVEYVIEESGGRIVVDGWDQTAMAEVAHHLDRKGFRIQNDDGESLVSCFTSHEVYQHLRHAHDMALHMAPERDHLSIHNINIFGDHSIPDDTAIAVHRHAIAPSLPEDVHRPWLVKYPDGVVVVGLTPEEGETDE